MLSKLLAEREFDSFAKARGTGPKGDGKPTGGPGGPSGSLAKEVGLSALSDTSLVAESIVPRLARSTPLVAELVWTNRVGQTKMFVFAGGEAKRRGGGPKRAR